MRSRRTRFKPLVASLALWAGIVPALAQDIETIEVTGNRLAPLAARQAYALTRIDATDIERAPQFRVDDILRQVPGFSLFRRASSLVAHPTTQGVTLRGLGPNGAGRTLVLYDGMPLNDPFGGWVYWSAIDPGLIGQINVVRGGGSGAFGNQALSGAIEIESRWPEAAELSAETRFGRFDSINLSARAALPLGNGFARFSGGYFDSDGFRLLPESQAGAADIPAASDVAWAEAAFRQKIGARDWLSIRARYFEEDRVNGLAFSTNDTEAFDISLRYVHDGGADGISAELTIFLNDRDFANAFAAVNDDRSQDRPVLDQFSVPAIGGGAIGLVRIPTRDSGTLELGVDIRRLSGETNELFRNLGSGFTRLRRAGGDQWLVGAWAEYAGDLGDLTTLSLGVRADFWRTFNGIRRELNLETGQVQRDDNISDRDDLVFDGRIGLRHQLTPAVGLRIAGYTAFRLPTINEFFRPFRVRNDITEANPLLDPERLYGIEFGVEYEPLNSVSFSADYFRNWLDGGVGNVTLAFGPGFFPPTGFVPAGGSLRQRRNIDLIVADGIELSGRISLATGLEIGGRYLFVDSRVKDSPDFTAIEGRRVAQSPKHSVSADIDWQLTRRAGVSAEGRFLGKQFDDDLNRRVLDSAFLVGLSGRYALTGNVSVFAAVENLFDKQVQSALSGDQLVTIAQPRLWWTGLRAEF